MIDPPLQIKLIDFGYSSYLTKLNQRVSVYSGTLVYLAPEVIKQRPYDGSGN
jgi:serine/threonine protein kinase